MRAVTKIISTMGDQALASAEDAESLAKGGGKSAATAPKVSALCDRDPT